MMTPETANGRGSVPLLGEMEDATGVDLVPGQSWLFCMDFKGGALFNELHVVQRGIGCCRMLQLVAGFSFGSQRQRADVDYSDSSRQSCERKACTPRVATSRQECGADTHGNLRCPAEREGPAGGGDRDEGNWQDGRRGRGHGDRGR